MIKDDFSLLDRLAEASAEAILPHFRRLSGVENKADDGFDPVTQADKAAEAALRAILASERPDDGILGEEFQNHAGSSGRTWIIDPIDGTRGFMIGLPVWGVLVALADASGPVLGMMSQPYVGERFLASPDGAFHVDRAGRRTPLATRPCASLDAAILTTTSPDGFTPEVIPRFAALARRCRMVRYGTDCYAYALLAAGHVDVVVEMGLKPFDIAPFVPIVEAAGGAITDFAGERIGPTLPHTFNGEAVAVGDASLLPAVLEVLNG
ncbi:inositol monophosphatase family protein [Acuticoccus sp. 2012]|uniref:Inositol monophosphatase family protein n=2 Tax=Acuticoccus mangrovi TaxID=2796142 RepID=A0A934IRU7_9HYPH|nr:inositol monophosphatase family protein [Acuticoccus mangrovi]